MTPVRTLNRSNQDGGCIWVIVIGGAFPVDARTQRVSVEIVLRNKSGSDAHPMFAAVRAIEPVPPTIAVRK
jgi:hypothetical protein